MPFGFKKDKDKEKLQVEDDKRSALFGSRSKSSKSPANQANPYAVQAPTNDPYAPKASDPYGQPPAYSSGSGPSQLRQDKSPVPIGGYGGVPSQSRFGGSGNYGHTGGYGSNPYGSTSVEQPQLQSQQRPGGYGGLGRTNSTDTQSTDLGRAALFGDAPARQQQQRPSGPYGAQSDQPSTADQSYSNTGGDSSFQGGYGAPQPERELTAEEQEDEDVQATKNEIRFLKQQDVASTRNARRVAEQTEAIGRDTLARLGQQGERIHNAERHLDDARTQNRIAQEKAAELKTLNRSMFAVHVSNPFTKTSREREANERALEKHQEERARTDATRMQAINSASRQAAVGRSLDTGKGKGKEQQTNLAQRSKFQFEADSEDEEMENEIDANLDAIHRGAKTLNAIGKAMGEELESQNKHIMRITGKSDLVSDEIAVNRARLDRIR